MSQARPGGTTPSSKTATRSGPGAERPAKQRERWRLRAAAMGALALSAFAAVACLDRPICTECNPETTNVFVDSVPQRQVDKIDLLFVIDNSRSMADKQVVLSKAVPDLVRRLVSPDCIAAGGERSPLGANGTCPAGSTAEFQPVKDIHIGVITSSLGDPTCGSSSTTNVLELQQRSDGGHMLGVRPRFKEKAGAPGLAPATPEGFLDWNPATRPTQKETEFNATFTLMTTSAGEIGCGYEAQLESFYRFLVDPVPPAGYNKVACPGGGPVECKARAGIDQALLNERKAFLRPNSLVAVILLTDENDCSVRDSEYGPRAADTTVAMQRGSSMCAQNPNDKCCYPCTITQIPSGCQPDPVCQQAAPNVNPGYLPKNADHDNLRCHNQKGRFGFDYLYPTARYVNALKQRRICVSRDALDGVEEGQVCPDNDKDGKPDIYDNPLYVGSPESLPRNPDLVFFAGIVGVPWQDIMASKDAKGNDYPRTELHYKTATELTTERVWDTILGDPNPPNGSKPVPPGNPLMIETTSVRTGNDAQGKALGAVNGPVDANPVNGHEWMIDDDARYGPGDLQYACVFPLPPDPVTGATSRSCVGNEDSCDCADRDPGDNNPLCQDPVTGQYGTTQFRAKAYPGLRELEVLKSFGKNSIVASICARNLTNDLAQDYGYRPAVDAIVERLKEQLSDQCLPRTLRKNADGKIPCAVVEVLPPGPGVTCAPEKGRSLPDSSVIDGVHERLRALGRCNVDGKPSCSTYQLCKLEEADASCHQAGGGQAVPGWCYIDPETQPGDDPKLVDKCQSNQRRIIRFVGENTPATGAEVVIACFGSSGVVEPLP